MLHIRTYRRQNRKNMPDEINIEKGAKEISESFAYVRPYYRKIKWFLYATGITFTISGVIFENYLFAFIMFILFTPDIAELIEAYRKYKSEKIISQLRQL